MFEAIEIGKFHFKLKNVIFNIYVDLFNKNKNNIKKLVEIRLNFLNIYLKKKTKQKMFYIKKQIFFHFLTKHLTIYNIYLLNNIFPCLTLLKKKVINPRDKLINHAKLLSDRFKKIKRLFPLLILKLLKEK